MTTQHEVYTVTVQPGDNAKRAAVRMARYVVQRWMPGNAGGVHVFATPQLATLLLPFFTRPKPTTLRVDTMGLTPVLTEIP